MRKIFGFIFCLGFIGMMIDASAAVPWWLQPTICKVDTTVCYSNMGTGYDIGMWDATSRCRGLKMICADATTNPNDTDSVLMGRAEIAAKTGLSQDFDTDILAGDCFGARKTSGNGNLVSVDGNFVKVWCNGVLPNPDEQVANGEIKFGTQPKCDDLAPDGWVAVLNQRCYGKQFDPSNYFIECTGSNDLPSKIIVLNGAWNTPVAAGYPATVAAAKSLFDTMQSVSAAQRNK